MRLLDVQREDLQRLVGTMLLGGDSVQAAKHVKTVASAVYTNAEREGWFTGPNPAKFANLPEMKRATPHALSSSDVTALLQLLPRVPRLMAFLAVMTSMNIAEICGLKWKRINLGSEPIMMDDERLLPCMGAVREQWYKSEWSSVKAKAGRRYVPLSHWVLEELRELQQREQWTRPEDPVFAGENGKPILSRRAGNWACRG